jgi:hypothetical protein
MFKATKELKLRRRRPPANFALSPLCELWRPAASDAASGYRGISV